MISSCYLCPFPVTDPLSATWNHMDEYNLLQSSRQKNLWRSAWQSTLLHWILGLILYLEWAHYKKKVDLLGKIMGVPNLSNNILTQSLSWGEKVCCIRNKLCSWASMTNVWNYAFKQKEQCMWMSGVNESTWQCCAIQLRSVVKRRAYNDVTLAI